MFTYTVLVLLTLTILMMLSARMQHINFYLIEQTQSTNVNTWRRHWSAHLLQKAEIIQSKKKKRDARRVNKSVFLRVVLSWANIVLRKFSFLYFLAVVVYFVVKEMNCYFPLQIVTLPVEAEVVSSCDDCLQVLFKLSPSVKTLTHQDDTKNQHRQRLTGHLLLKRLLTSSVKSRTWT